MTDIEADVCIVGSGFGGTMAAWGLVQAGYNVVLVERGDWVGRGPHNWAPDGTGDTTEYYNRESPIRVVAGGNAPEMGAYHCVGGPSNFYGGVSLRFREADFVADEQLVGESGALWPFAYDDLAPYYNLAERLLDVAGDDSDPVLPRRSEPYPQRPAPVAEVSHAIANAARETGLSPFRLPLAINYRQDARTCQLCPTCDTYACAVSAKNDLATAVLPGLIERGLTLLVNHVATQLQQSGGRITGLRIVDRFSGDVRNVRAGRYVLGAGALGSPHLVLASGLQQLNPAADAVGAYLMRHVNATVYGLYARLPGSLDQFHKQFGIHDLYFGSPDFPDLGRKIGSIQQIHSPPVELVKHYLGRFLGTLVSPLARRMTGLLAIAEDQPNRENRVWVDSSDIDQFGLPRLCVSHTYSDRDDHALAALTKTAKRVLRRSGAWIFYTHRIKTFSHAVGTLRMGDDDRANPVDRQGRFRGTDNLFVTDGSIFPTAAAVNPSLTIAANALRISELIAVADQKTVPTV